MTRDDDGLGAARGCLAALAITALVTAVFAIPAIVYFASRR